MRRMLVSLLSTALVAGAAPGAVAGDSLRSKAPATRTFYVVAGASDDACALSVDRSLAEATHGCGTWSDAATAPVLGSETTWFDALDGLPLALDVARPLRGSVTVHSRYLVGWVVPSGAGQAQLKVTVTGVAGGEEVTVGSVTSESYTVTPDRMEYEVPFRIEPDAGLAGVTLSELRLGVEVTGANVLTTSSTRTPSPA